jgi:hypothetical protein
VRGGVTASIDHFTSHRRSSQVSRAACEPAWTGAEPRPHACPMATRPIMPPALNAAPVCQFAGRPETFLLSHIRWVDRWVACSTTAVKR